MQQSPVLKMAEMVPLGEETSTPTVLFPNPTTRLLSHGNGTSNGKTHRKQILFKQDVKQDTAKVNHSESKHHVFSHGLHHLHHFSCDSPVRSMMYSEAVATFISLHSDNTVCLYKADGHKETSLAHLSFMGLTETKFPGYVVGWGPGPVFTLLDRELHPLDAAHDALDICVCQAAEHSAELVTAGFGNVCVWSVMLMRCMVKIQEEPQHSTFTQMALAPPRSDKPHRAFVVCRQVVTVVDLDAGKVLEHKRDLCSRDITAIVYCSQLDCLITACEELSIRIWGPDWKLCAAFVGHNGVVNSLFYSSALSMVLSASVDCTIRCWDVEKGDMVMCVHTEQKNPLLCIGGSKTGDTFFSFSHQGVDIWTIRTLYTLHCKLRVDEGAPLRQILASSLPTPYPARLLCVSGDSDIMLVAAETGAVLTSFKAKQRILCADYCLQKELLLALTDTGTVLQANTLTNPITLMQEWKGRGQGPWQHRDLVTGNKVLNLPIPGPACCLILYSYVAETQASIEEWRSLQERRGCSHRDETALGDAKNRFLIILGQSGGCVSVLKIDNGQLLHRVPAHNGHRVTTMQVYPENSYLLSAGEDMTVVMWTVNPHVQKCLSQLLSLHCGQPQVYLAVLGLQLAQTFQEPSSDPYNLMHFNLLNQSQTDHQTKGGHADHFTALCVCPDLEVFVSSGLDGTLCIWNKENRLIRTLQLDAVPECLAYSGCGGELFLGFKGDLYRMSCIKFMPHNYQLTHLKPLPDIPTIENKEKCSKRKNASTKKGKEEELSAVTSNILLTQDRWRHKEYKSSVTSNMDPSALLCEKRKHFTAQKLRKDAFDRYMKIIYRLPPNIKIDLEDTFDPDTLEINSIYPEPNDDKPHNRPTLKEDIHRETIKIPVKVIDWEDTFDPDTLKINSVYPEPNDDKPHNLPTLKEDVHRETVKIPGNVKNKMEKKAPATISKPKTPIRVEKYEEQPPEIIFPIEQPKPKTSTPCPRPRPCCGNSLREPTPKVPTFLKQFADAGWFKDLYPDKRCIPSTLSPGDFSLQLLGRLNTCSTPSKLKILAALQALHSQGLLHSTDRLYQDLIDLVPKFARPHMSSEERAVLAETLNLLMRLKSANCDFVKKLLTLLSLKKLGLREMMLRILAELGVNEAKQWLWPELESWDLELQGQSDIWKSLHDRADSWLQLWINKYKRYLYPRSTAKKKPLIFSMVDVLNYFCSVQKEYREAQCDAPAGRKITVLLPPYDCSCQPILHQGKTNSLVRIWKPPVLHLPTLRNHPFLVKCPKFISLPLTRVTLLPFHTYSDEDWVKFSPPLYFFPQQSHVEYYR